MRLNDGLEEPEESVKSPTAKHRHTHAPLRSGPSTRRQRAQKTVTSPPAQVLAITPVRSKDDDSSTPNKRNSGVSGVQLIELNNVPQRDTQNLDEISGVQHLDNSEHDVYGVQPSISGVRDVNLISTVQSTDAARIKGSPKKTEDRNNESATIDASISDTLPDLVLNSSTVNTEFSNLPGLSNLPPVGETPPDHIFDGGTTTTEDEFDAVDALLSLSTARTNTSDDNEDNSTLMPIGGESQFVDVNPVRVELDQVTVDGAIAQIVEMEEHLREANPDNENNENSTAPSDVTKDNDDALNKNSDLKEDSVKPDLENPYNADTEVDETDPERSTKGYVKITTHGIKKKSTLEGRSYRCAICGKSKRSAQQLNIHHRQEHGSQMCGICGKIFELASSLTHHMYSHEERRYYCDKCSFHSHFESELTKHKVTHHTEPQHQCMHSKCGHWFMRKADLVLHVETHRNNIIKCDICGHTTNLKKYMNEHMKSHNTVLPYKCDICNKRFMWRSGVRPHKQKEHTSSKK